MCSACRHGRDGWTIHKAFWNRGIRFHECSPPPPPLSPYGAHFVAVAFNTPGAGSSGALLRSDSSSFAASEVTFFSPSAIAVLAASSSRVVRDSSASNADDACLFEIRCVRLNARGKRTNTMIPGPTTSRWLHYSKKSHARTRGSRRLAPKQHRRRCRPPTPLCV